MTWYKPKKKKKTTTPCVWAPSVPPEQLVPSPETLKLQTRKLLQVTTALLTLPLKDASSSKSKNPNWLSLD